MQIGSIGSIDVSNNCFYRLTRIYFVDFSALSQTASGFRGGGLRQKTAFFACFFFNILPAALKFWSKWGSMVISEIRELRKSIWSTQKIVDKISKFFELDKNKRNLVPLEKIENPRSAPLSDHSAH